jgi:transcription initiation factor TFIIB
MSSAISEVDGSGEPEETFKEDLNRVVMCPDCKEFPPNLVEEFSSGDLVCGDCGLVVGDRIIDTRSEWRTFSNDDQNGDDPSRVGDGPNLLLEGDQLETTIAFDGGKGSKNLSHIQNKMMNDKGTKALLQAYREIGTLTDSMGAGQVVANAAKHLYKIVEKEKFLKGKPQEAVIAGCIFIACRQNNVPRSFREIFKLTRVSKKEIGRVFKLLEKFMTENKDKVAGMNMDTQGYQGKGSTSAAELCARYCSQLTFINAFKIERLSRQLAEQSVDMSDLAGRSPLSVAAACIYFACHLFLEARPSRDIASIAGVSDGTVKTAYRFLWNLRVELLDKIGVDDKLKANIEKLPTP